MKIEKKHYILGGIILVLILIYVFRKQILRAFGVDEATIDKFCGGGWIARQYYGGGRAAGPLPVSPGFPVNPVVPVNPVIPRPVIINPTVVSEREITRCCDWLDNAAYQACLAQGYHNCGKIYLANCNQGCSDRTPFTVEQINIESRKRGIPDNIRIRVIRSLIGVA